MRAARRCQLSTARRLEALQRLQRIKARKTPAMRADPGAAGELAMLATETVRRIEERIRYWMALGDQEHVRRLADIRNQLLTKYQRRLSRNS